MFCFVLFCFVEVEVEVEEAASPRLHRRAKQGLEPEFRKRFGALPQSVPHLRKRSRASSPATATGLACYRTCAAPASVEFISAELTTESYQRKAMGLDGERKVAQLVHDGRGLRGLTRKIIQGALHTTSPQFTDMRVDHGR